MSEQTNPVLQRLEALAGEWEVVPIIDGAPAARSKLSCEWVEQGAFMRQRTTTEIEPGDPAGWEGAAPTSSSQMIGLDDRGEDFTVLYADSRGVVRVYTMTFGERSWTMHRDAPGFHQRFVGEISDDGNTIDARWEGSPDGEEWALDFRLTYARSDQA